MVAVDTNVLIRLFVDDNPDQVRAAKHVVGTNEIFIPLTVLLECEWVLRFTYKLNRNQIIEVMNAIAKMRNSIIEHEGRLAETLRLYEHGLDFGDAIHLASSGDATSLATFDQDFCRLAEGLTACIPFIPQPPA